MPNLCIFSMLNASDTILNRCFNFNTFLKGMRIFTEKNDEL